MKIVVVYGGRGLIEDPTLYVLEKMQMVLEELRVEVKRINLYEERNQISTFPAQLKDCDGVVLASSLEWFGMGGYMQEFLDACWLYGDRNKIQTLYMMPVVLSTTNGEKDVQLSLIKAWEVLGGMPAEGICAYVENPVDFEMNKSYGKYIEKQTEQLYRTINQKMTVLPSSSTAIRNKVLKRKSIDLTPQESEQLSKFVSDDAYVKQQKEDIEELSSIFKEMLNDSQEKENREMKEKAESSSKFKNGILGNETYSQAIPRDVKERFKKAFHPLKGQNVACSIVYTDKEDAFCVTVSGSKLAISTGAGDKADVTVRLASGILNRITIGDMTFQRAFMCGDLKIKGDFKALRLMDQLFPFSE